MSDPAPDPYPAVALPDGVSPRPDLGPDLATAADVMRGAGSAPDLPEPPPGDLALAADEPGLPDDPTLEEIARALAPAIAANAAFDGWGAAARDYAAEGLGIDAEVAALALPTPFAMIDAWFAWIDGEMLADLPPERLAAMRVRERITALIEARLAVAAPDREALRRALAVLALPTNAAAAVRLGWRAADRMWRAAGDAATDLNHYTKRATLLAVYGATVTVFLDDESEDHADTSAFLSRRIDGLMRFERAKARLAGRSERRPSLSRFLGRLRYPAV